jgi:hypothetical protein
MISGGSINDLIDWIQNEQVEQNGSEISKQGSLGKLAQKLFDTDV